MKSEYIRMRHLATILRDDGGYNIGGGECNPVIFQEFIGEVLDTNLAPVIWEPFAGHSHCNLDYCAEIPGVRLMAQDIDPTDKRVIRGDSTRQGPPRRPSGLFFHPPYFGSNSFSAESGELGMETDMGKYLRALARSIALANLHLGGLACAVCRVYRHGGKNIDLPAFFLEIFVEAGYELTGMWSSEPDVVLILRRMPA